MQHPTTVIPLGRLHLGDAPDELLVERSTDGDSAAFEVLVYRYGPLMRAYAIRVLGSNSEADDVLQDVFIQAWNKLDELRDPTAVRSWLMRMVSNKAIERIRSRRETVDISDVNEPARENESPAHITEVREQVAALTRVVEKLPDVQRQCWVLKELGQLSYQEIAEQLGVSQPTVRGQLARARKTILHEMEEWR